VTRRSSASASAFRRRVGRFLLSGAVNTGVTYVIYLLLLRVVSYTISFTIAFAAGIALSFILNRTFVFGKPRLARRHLLFPLVYVVQYLVGLGIVHLWVGYAGWEPRWAPLASIVVTVPLTFLLSKWVLAEPQAIDG
jgi:putative flippase GtrA